MLQKLWNVRLHATLQRFSVSLYFSSDPGQLSIILVAKSATSLNITWNVSNITDATYSLAPSAAPKVSWTFATSYSITLQWETVPCEQRNGDITGYLVKYEVMGSLGNEYKTVMNITGAGVTEATIFNLMLSTDYSIQIAAVNNAGTGVFSIATIIKTVEQSKF